MAAITQICRILTALFFIFLGFIKANDTIGFSYKLDEYFYLFGIAWLVPASVFIAGFFCVLETMLGFYLLIGMRITLILWILFALTICFASLTFYLAYYDKVSDCGCFGDFLKIPPWYSFAKDTVLLVMIILLLIKRRNIRPVFSGTFSKILLTIALITSVVFPIYTYNYLPVFNFLPFKIGTDLLDLRILPAKAASEVIKSKVYFTFMDADNNDKTEEFLKKPGYKFLLVSYDLDKAGISARGRINDFVDLCRADSIPFVGLTSSPSEKIHSFRHEVQAMYDYYTTDETVLKSMIRSNPGLILLKGPVIKQMWHYHTIPAYNDVKKKMMGD